MHPLNFLLVVLLIFVPALSSAQSTVLKLTGNVQTSGKPVSGATVTLVTAEQTIVASGETNREGHYQIEGITPGSYSVTVSAQGFSPRRLEWRSASGSTLNISLSLAPIREQVTVTADPGRVEGVNSVLQEVNVISADDIGMRATAVTAQVAAEEPGLFLQRTSPTIGAVYVRGLTGNKVNTFIDGVRYSNSAARGGINTFFNLIDPGVLESVEVLRGPNSAQYGSDALGGSVQLLTKSPLLLETPAWHSSLRVIGNSADASFGSNTTISYGTRHFGIVGALDAHRMNGIRPGGGVDSHSAFTRYFGLPSDRFIDGRLPDTAFTQYGGMLRANWMVAENTQLAVTYMRGQQDGGRRYDQTLGGDGNLVADLRNLMTDFLYVRLDRQKLGWFNSANVTYSYNSQREERVNQGGNGNKNAAINHEPERTTVNGIRAHLDKQWAGNDLLLGADYYHERVDAPSFGFNPVTNVSTVRRGRVPDNALYRQGGIFLQDSYDLLQQRLRFVGSVRYSSASYRAKASDSPLVDGVPLWPNDSLRAADVSFRAGVVGSPTHFLTLSFGAARGFRAPHITDLGTLGLTGSGFEIAAADVAGMGGTIGNSAASTAVSTGTAVSQVKPETSMEYDWSLRFRSKPVDATVSFFINNINDNITKQALILPTGAVGEALGGNTITSQNANGVVFVAASPSPVLVRANYDDARLWGIEHRGDIRINSRVTVGTVLSYVHAKDLRTGLAPNIEGGTPPLNGYLKIRYAGGNGRWWIEPYMFAAARQDRLSSLDLEDRRTGATRSRSNIQNFFRNGATVRGHVGPGTDGIFGNADDILLTSNETLLQIQNRVLGVGVNSAPLYTAVPGYATFNIRGGMRLGEKQRLTADFSNLGDKNYRGISWGVDAPGRSLTLQWAVNF